MKGRKAYLGLGSNLGERERNIKLALEGLAKVPGIKVTRCSSFYETEPVDVAGGCFINAAIEIETALHPISLWRHLQALEREMGRPETRERGSPRTIDFDLLLYEDWIYEEGGLIIPHPSMHQRRFVLEPLREIAPDVRHPKTGKKIEDLLMEMRDGYRVVRLGNKGE